MKMSKLGEAVFFLIMICVIVAAPSLLVWKFHIMSLSDPSVLIGMIAVYLFGVIAACFGIYFLKNSIAEKRSEHMIGINKCA